VARARQPTVEGEIFLDGGATGCAIAPAGVSIETHEAVELRDGRRAFGGYGFGVEGAGANVDRSSKALLDPLLKNADRRRHPASRVANRRDARTRPR